MTKRTLSDFFGGRTTKLASGQTDPGPDNHPASVEPGVTIPTGDTMAAAKSVTPELVGGDKAVTGAEGGSEKDKKPAAIGTEVGTISNVPTTPITGTVEDQGTDSHPASAGGEKYASCNSVSDVISLMQSEINTVISKLASLPDAAIVGEPKRANAPTLAEVDPVADLGQKLAALLHSDDPSEKAKRQLQATHKVASLIGPWVNSGVAMADDLVNFIKLAEQDPAAAAAMLDPAAMGGDPAMMGGDPAAMGGDPAMMGGDPAAMGGDPAAMGGDPMASVTPEQIQAAVEQLAQQMGTTPDAIYEMLEDEAEGAEGGEGGEGGGMPPDAGAANAAAAVTGGESDAAASADPAMSDEGTEGKTASAPGQNSSMAKIAKLLALELGKTPAQVANQCRT